jgi:predicted dehydrogenase/nucleoside-diphosphate-sugar epimerase
MGQDQVPSQARLRVGIVGAGRISEIHLDTLAGLDGVDVVAICDKVGSRAQVVAAARGIPAHFDSLATMLAESRPNVVHLLTPPFDRVEAVTACAEHGAHMYIEKPFALTEADARVMLEAARVRNLRLCPGHNRLFDPPMLEARRRIGAGEIGRVVTVRAEQGFLYGGGARTADVSWSFAGDWGLYWNLMPHPLYLAAHFLKQPQEPSVLAFNLETVREAAVEELRVTIPSDGASAEVLFSMNLLPEENRVEILGTAGRITVDLNGMSVIHYGQGQLPSGLARFTRGFSEGVQHVLGSAAVTTRLLTGRVKRYPGMRRLIAEFHASLRSGAALPVSSNDGLVNARLLEQIQTAARFAEKRRGRVVRVGRPGVSEILVTGGTGFLGGRLLERLSEDGISVRALVRLGNRTRELRGVEWLEGDLRDPDALRRAVEGMRTVYHCAALVAAPGSSDEFARVNVDASRLLVEAAAAAGVERLVHMSSVGVYRAPSGRFGVVDESSPVDDRIELRGFYSKSKLDAERVLDVCVSSHPRPTIVVLRAGLIYGPGAAIPVARVRLTPSPTRPIVVGSRRLPMPLVYVDNVVDAMILASRANVPSGRRLNLIDDPSATQGVVADLLDKVSRGRLRPIFVPHLAVWPAMAALDVLSLVRGRGAGSARYRLRRSLASFRVSSDAARTELGWSPRVSIEEGLSRTWSRVVPESHPY